jgi:hypothetical protein
MDANQNNRQRAYWLKTLHQWHWISSALCLLGMLLFSVTGITLNHSAQIEGKPQVTTLKGLVPEALRAELAGGDDKKAAPLPAGVRGWLADTMKVRVADDAEGEWSPDEVYVALPRPGGDAWVRIDRESGDTEYESTDRGWISYLNDLHKGRHTGVAWSWFIDIFAAAALLFSITGLFILKMHAANRPTTWPIVGLGIVIPVVLALLFIH